MSDWQSIGNDPCSAINSPELVTRELPQLDKSLPPTSSSEVQQSSENYTTLQLREACEALSTPEHQCHWNPVSQFTGKYCQDCRPVCRSVRRSLNFFQFCLGVGLLTVSIPISTVVIVVIASDVVSVEMQVINNIIMCKVASDIVILDFASCTKYSCLVPSFTGYAGYHIGSDMDGFWSWEGDISSLG